LSKTPKPTLLKKYPVEESGEFLEKMG